MNYYVEWTPVAHDLLEKFWMAAEDPRLVLRAANAIDAILARDPRSADVIVADENTLIVEPLAVDFHVDEARRKVQILFVWLIDYLNGPDAGH
jgi:hypothetical protein